MQDSEVVHLSFDLDQARALTIASEDLAGRGGPQKSGVASRARQWAQGLSLMLSSQQKALLQRFADGQLSALMFSHMPCPGDDPVPLLLPDLPSLEQSPRCQYLAARSQLLLEMVRHRSFAFDIDNLGQQVRLIGNFKGGGHALRPDEDRNAAIELSSHTGL